MKEGQDLWVDKLKADVNKAFRLVLTSDICNEWKPIFNDALSQDLREDLDNEIDSIIEIT